MRPALRAVADRNGGPFTRRDAVLAGYTERELRTLTGHRGRWVVLRRGVYVEREVHDGCDEDARYLLRTVAAVLAMPVPRVLSHTSAAALHRLPLRPRWRELVHVTRPDVRGGRTEGGVRHHLGSFDGEPPVRVLGWPATGLARTAVDVGREYGFEDGVVAGDAARRLGATRAQFEHELDRMEHWPGVRDARAAAEFADPGAATVGESLMRVLVAELGLPGDMETQYVVSDGRRTAYVDLRVGRHLFEFDGRTKYLGRAEGGVADRPVSEVLWEEKKREDWLRRTQGGHGVSRVVWAELFGSERRRTKERLRREYDDTVRRFGLPAV